MTYRALIFITASAEDGPGMPCKCLVSALVVCQSSVSQLSAFFKFFLEGSADLSIALKPRPQSLGLEMSSFSLSSSEGAFPLWGDHLFIGPLLTFPQVVLWLAVFQSCLQILPDTLASCYLSSLEVY